METSRYQERLTPDNAALLLIDHEVWLFTGVREIPVRDPAFIVGSLEIQAPGLKRVADWNGWNFRF